MKPPTQIFCCLVTHSSQSLDFFIKNISGGIFLVRIMDVVYGYFAGTTRPKELSGLNREMSVLDRVRVKFFFFLVENCLVGNCPLERSPY